MNLLYSLCLWVCVGGGEGVHGWWHSLVSRRIRGVYVHSMYCMWSLWLIELYHLVMAAQIWVNSAHVKLLM